MRLRQVILNLVANALKFTDTGSVELIVEVIEKDPLRATLEFSIKDTGIGIPKEKHKYIFENCTQTEVDTTRKFGGTGLGTNISNQQRNKLPL